MYLLFSPVEPCQQEDCGAPEVGRVPSVFSGLWHDTLKCFQDDLHLSCGELDLEVFQSGGLSCLPCPEVVCEVVLSEGCECVQAFAGLWEQGQDFLFGDRGENIPE